MTVLTGNKALQVAVGVVQDSAGRILISRRSPDAHQGGLWEFPGGKIENGESVEQALARELYEELAIRVGSISPLINIVHQYSDLKVQLHVCSVSDFSGQAQACEGQQFSWVYKDQLVHYDFPEANKPIITAITLPRYYAILDDGDPGRLLSNLSKILAKDVKLIQARLKNSSPEEVDGFVTQAIPLCQQYNAEILFNSSVDSSFWLQLHGVHLTSQDLMALSSRPTGLRWLAASCHTLAELLHAQEIGVDFVVLAPVAETKTHPGQSGMGWRKYAELVAQVNIPVFALGGMTFEQYHKSINAGSQGIAGIRLFLD